MSTIKNTLDIVLNRSVGLANSSGDEKLYGQLLREYRKVHSKDFEKIIAALEAGDQKSACRLAHTLKSSSAIIGAVTLSEAAFKVEKALSKGAGEWPEISAAVEGLMKDVETHFTALAAELELLPEREASGIPPDREAILKLVEKLAPLLENSDSAVFKLRDEIEDVLAPLGEDGEVLLDLIDEFELPQAAKVLDKIKDSFGPE